MATRAAEKTKTRQEATARFEALYKKLNKEQRKAVDTIEGPAMVMAGPGTGKTQVLSMRIANILKTTQMDPWNILCLTFTESGAVAMRERLFSIIGTPAYYVSIHTFHSFCNEIIQENPEIFAWTRNVQVISDIERILIFRSIINKLSSRSPLKPFGDPYFYFNDVMGNIKDLKREDISPQQFVEIIKSLKSCIESSQKDVEVFLALSPKERTHEKCASINDALLAAAKHANLPKSMQALLHHFFDLYEEELNGAEGSRETSKARTAYKNNVKKWWQKSLDTLPRQEAVAHVYKEYQVALKRDGRLDFEDMIIKVVEELKKNDALLAKYQEQFQYILVDEYQDTNGAQNDVVDLLSSFDDTPNVFVVGDDKQSIYRFQGASLSNMLHFYEKYKESISVISLQENYRSTQTILDAASGVISHNKESVARYVPGVIQELKAASGRQEERITAHTFDSSDAEHYFIASRAKELIAAGVTPQEIAILYRKNKDGAGLLPLLQRLGVPARLEMGENVLEDHIVQQWIMLLTFLAKRGSDDILAHILHYAWWHLPAVDTLKAIHYAMTKRLGLYAVLASANHLRAAEVEHVSAFQEFSTRLATWHADAVQLSLQLALEKIVVESHFLDHVMENDGQAAALRKVTTLLAEGKSLQMEHRDFKLTDFIEHLSLLKEHNVSLLSEPWQSKQQAVRLMSAHKAKGLEFEHVFIMRLNDRHWGNTREPNKAPLPAGLVKYDYVVASDNNEDERRLFYVALTRGKQHIYLTRAKHSETGRAAVPAIFLHEIPAELVAIDTTQETDADSLLRLTTTLLAPIPHTSSDEARDYIASLLDGYVMSVTHLNNYLDCPRKFYFRNLLQLPMAKTKSLAMGSAVHDGLYELFVAINESGNVPPQEFVIKAFEIALQRQLLSSVDMAHALEQGRHIVSVYYEHYKQEFYPHTLLEYDFAPHHVQINGMRITGKIDKIEIIDAKNKKINVVDYKTGNVERGLKKLQPGGDYRRQLIFYQLLCNEAPRFAYDMVSAEIDFVEGNAKEVFMKKKIEVTKEELGELKSTIALVGKEIYELKFLDPAAGCGKKECEYCTR